MPTHFFSLTAVAAAAWLAIGAGDASAQGCLHWGSLDKTLYCDENRDLLADTPSQGFQLLDPDTLVFSYAAQDGAADEEQAFAEFIAHLASKTGKQVRWSAAKSSAQQIKAMRDSQVQLAGIAPGPTVYAVNLAGYVPIAVMCRADGTFDYKLQLITRKDASIASLSDLAGKKVAYTSKLANTGTLSIPGSETVYSGSQSQSVAGVIKGEFAAAAVNSNDFARMQKQGGIDASALNVLWESPPFPSTSFGFAYNLAPGLQRSIHDAFLTFEWKGTGLARVFGTQADKFCTVSYQDAWDSIRQIQLENGVVYNVDDL